MPKPNKPLSRGSRNLHDNRPLDNDKNDEKDKNEEEQEPKMTTKQYLISLGRDILIAVIVMTIIIGSLWGYTGNWPPMVVIESDSMMHGDDSNVGTIDTGDLVLVKKIHSEDDVTTYVEGKKTGYKTYDSYGDVIIFKKNGLDDTPVIHRAVVWIEYNENGSNGVAELSDYGSFDIPSLGLYNVTDFYIEDYIPNHINLSIDLNNILKNFQKVNREPHSGFIIKGDNNLQVDQLSSLEDKLRRPVEPIKTEWIVGKAQGELPWFGLIKLYISGDTENKNSEPPETSKKMLVISIVLIIVIPIILDVLFTLISKYRRKRNEETDDSQESNDKHDYIRGGLKPSSSDRDHNRSNDKENFKGGGQAKDTLKHRYAGKDDGETEAIPKNELLKKIK